MLFNQPINAHSGQKQIDNIDIILQAKAYLDNIWWRNVNKNITTLLQIFCKNHSEFHINCQNNQKPRKEFVKEL